MIKQHLENQDCELLENRDKKRYRAKVIRETSVKTKLGTIVFERRLYKDTQTNEYVYLLDEAVNMHCIGLVDEGLCKAIGYMICEQSYRETAACVSELTGQIVSVSDIKKAYDKALGRETNSSHIYKVLHRHGLRRVILDLKSQKKPEYKKGRLMFQDDAGFGRINKPKHCWCKSGTRPCVP